MIRIVILGSGNLAYSLARNISDSELNLVQIYSRNKQEGEALANACNCEYTDSLSTLVEADLYIMAVSDKAIKQLSEQINIGYNSVLAHTAGSVDIDTLSPNVRNRAVIYPLQTFTKGRLIDLKNVPVFIEGSNDQSLACARLFAENISSNVKQLNSEKRAKLHLAAIFASNFTNHMYVLAEKLVENGNMDFEVLKPLIQETTLKAMESKSPIETQTGPAIRNDYQTKSKHCEMLSHHPELKTLYINLSNSIWETSKKI